MNYILFIIDGHWVVFSIFVFINNVDKFLCGRMLLFLLDFYLGVELLESSLLCFYPWDGKELVIIFLSP